MDNKCCFDVILIDNQENSMQILKNFLTELDCISSIVDCESIDRLLNIETAKRNIIVFADISSDIEKTLANLKTLQEQNEKYNLFAISNKLSTDIIIKAFRSGVKEVLTKPLLKSDVFDAINKVKLECEDSQKNNHCKVISTFSNKGGIGKTSIAVNLAVELAQLSKEKVALIDLNLQLGDIATFLDITPTFTIDYIANNIHNLDDKELLNALPRYKNTTLYVLADPLNIDNSQDVTAEQIKTLIEKLKQSFSYIVVDIGTSIDSKTISALNYSDLILLIAIANLPAIRNTQRCLDLFNKLGYDEDKIKIVINRHMENETIKITDIEDALKQKVYWKIPNNYLTMMSAINKGVPVNEINRDSNISLNYMEFASKLSDYLIMQKLNKKYISR